MSTPPPARESLGGDGVVIGGIRIGPGEPTYTIAEIGSNHNGSIIRAFELIQLAADAGADCAKFQLYRADKLYPGQVTPGAIPDYWLPELKACCHENGVEFMCSVFCEETLEAYMLQDPAAIKIASPEGTNLRFARSCASYRIPVLASTGAMIRKQVWALNEALVGCPRVLLHCVSAYPPELSELNLRAITEMSLRLNWPIGFSDHTLDEITVPALAVAAGACVIEKHFTYDRNAEGPDHPFALLPDEFASMVETIRATEKMLGDGVKRPTASEDPTDRRMAA